MEEIDIIIPFLYADEKLNFTIGSISPFLGVKINKCICINDGFDDNPTKFDKSSDIEFHNYKGNKGVSYARNLGLKMSKSKFVLFLDSGDQFLDFKEADFNVDVICFNHINEHEKLINQKDIPVKNVLKSLIWGEAKYWICSILFKRSWLNRKNLKFKEGISWGEDVEFIVRNILYDASIGFNNSILVRKYDDINSLTSNAKNKLTKDIIRYFLFKDLIKVKNLDEIQVFLSNFIISIIYRDTKSDQQFFSNIDKAFFLKNINLKILRPGILIKFLYLQLKK